VGMNKKGALMGVRNGDRGPGEKSHNWGLGSIEVRICTWPKKKGRTKGNVFRKKIQRPYLSPWVGFRERGELKK